MQNIFSPNAIKKPLLSFHFRTCYVCRSYYIHPIRLDLKQQGKNFCFCVCHKMKSTTEKFEEIPQTSPNLSFGIEMLLRLQRRAHQLFRPVFTLRLLGILIKSEFSFHYRHLPFATLESGVVRLCFND